MPTSEVATRHSPPEEVYDYYKLEDGEKTKEEISALIGKFRGAIIREAVQDIALKSAGVDVSDALRNFLDDPDTVVDISLWEVELAKYQHLMRVDDLGTCLAGEEGSDLYKKLMYYRDLLINPNSPNSDPKRNKA